ncbi:NlpC/P60 family protein [Methyloceanibacter sp. wino2]|uniref:C40 family peptidase n=1 Tax=Methyloceanibacter sp. wino2 TaxID=2170729 RepID=UPI000D3E7145|nr:NlpC/P60 family protein [Methyloceanibacter sp. wino2]
MTKLDPRRHAFRDDLAAESLRGVVDAGRYVQGERRQVAASTLPLRRKPRDDANLDTEALHGETVMVFHEADGWAWVQLDHDGYVGYVPSEGLGSMGAPATHRIAALRTYVFPEPDAKAPPQGMLSLNARVSVTEEGGRYVPLETGGFVYASHIVPVGHQAPDFVAVAEGFLGAPYLWGGRTSVGLDCSGLVQLAAGAAGHVLPRDADMQEAEAGEPLDIAGGAGLQRGDLIFWEGHVGIMTSADEFLHANAYHMAVEREPFEEARRRIKDAGFEVTSARRLAAKL